MTISEVVCMSFFGVTFIDLFEFLEIADLLIPCFNNVVGGTLQTSNTENPFAVSELFEISLDK
jgi:hypothetical protein